MPSLVPTTPYHAVLMCMSMAMLLKNPLDSVDAFQLSASPHRRCSPPASSFVPGSGNLIPGSRRHAPICFSSKPPSSSSSSPKTTMPRPFWNQHPASSAPPASSLPSSKKSSNNGNFWSSLTENKESRNGSAEKEKEAPPSVNKSMGDLVKALQGGGDNDSSSAVAKTESRLAKKNVESGEDDDEGLDAQTFLYGAGAVVAAGGLTYAHSLGLGPQDLIQAGDRLIHNPQDTLQDVIASVEAMGPLAPLYFGIVYLIAEVLAVPATPLTLSAGYLFGLTQGVGVVLVAATIAASISFFIGKTFLRSWVETVLEENEKFAKIDKAIAKEGFKLLLLVRLSPIFPFALSNYLYGASAIDFGAFFWGTLLGFTPGTVAYVYTGMVGKALTMGQGEPWYVYAGGFGALLVFLKIVTDVATNIVDAIDDDGDVNSNI